MTTPKTDKNAPASPTGAATGISGGSLNPLDAISADLKGFKDRIEAENDRRALATDPEYFVCVFFQSRAQKEAFLTAAGLLELGDKYLDGTEVAAKMGFSIPKVEITFHEEQTNRMITANMKPIGGE